MDFDHYTVAAFYFRTYKRLPAICLLCNNSYMYVTRIRMSLQRFGGTRRELVERARLANAVTSMASVMLQHHMTRSI